MANEQLRSMLNNLINEKSTEATLDFHQYLTEKVKSIVGLSEGASQNRHLMDKEVKILSGKYKGKTGYVNKLIGNDEAEIQLDDDGDEFYVNVKLTDIKKLDESHKDGSDIASHVMVHKSFPERIKDIKKDLERAHSVDKKELKTTQEGDFVKIHLPNKSYNTIDAVQRTLRNHVGPGFSIDNVM